METWRTRFGGGPGWVIAGALLTALALAGRPAPGGAEEPAVVPLRALVLECAGPWNEDAKSAATLLANAGFETAPLPLALPPRRAQADLIVIGSLASGHADWAKYVKAHGAALAAFVEEGGVVLEFTQAKEREARPAFLPAGLEASRDDENFQTLFVLAGDHPLLAGLPRTGDRLDLPGRAPPGRQANSSSLVWQRGFRVLVASDPAGQFPALIEAGAGRGRVLLASLWLDTVLDGAGKPTGDAAWAAAGERFFRNLQAFVRMVRDGVAPTPSPSIHPDAIVPEPQRGPPVAVRMGLAPSDLALYERSAVTRTADRITRRGGTPVTIHGHDLRDAGQYLPTLPRRADLPSILAFRLPPADAAAGGIDAVLDLGDTDALRLRGRVEAFEAEAGRALVVATYEFTGRAGASDAPLLVRNGKAEVRADFDRREGVVTRAFVRLSYDFDRTDPKDRNPAKKFAAEYEFLLKELKRTRCVGFQADVDSGIESGLAWLRGQQKADGTFEPHGDWLFGTTALAVFTLVSMGVPLDDPGVERGLSWMKDREPDRTYERALGLLAMERAYTPAAEVASEWRGGPVEHRRDLPPARQRWCERTAKALERSAPSPGFWCYPQTNPRVLLKHDTSNSQYAVLGLRAAARLGIEVSEATWLGVLKYYEMLRGPKGPRGFVVLIPEGQAAGQDSAAAAPVPEVAGFRYSTVDLKERVRGSMTAAGIASLSIARHELRVAKSRRLTPVLDRRVDELILGAWAWLDAEWAIDRHPGSPVNGWYYYWLYSLERAGILSRVRLVGGKDWYFEGAVQILARQRKSGAWGQSGADDIPETCFALLFLKRATPPITPSGR
jgi:hypothetical protein